MNCPPLLSATWFPPTERVAATAIGYISQSVGIAVAFLLCPFIVTSAERIPALNRLQAVLGALCVAVAAFFPKQPARAPSASAGAAKHSFFAGLRVLLRHRPYLLLALLSSLTTGVPAAFQGFLDQYLTAGNVGFTDVQVGWIGFSATIAGVVAGMAVCGTVDALRLNLRRTVLACVGAGAAFIAMFVLEVYGADWSADANASANAGGGGGGGDTATITNQIPWHHNAYSGPGPHSHSSYASYAPPTAAPTADPAVNFWPVLLSVTGVGAAMGAVGSLELEMAADMTFPVSEETSATVLTLGYSAVSVAGMFFGGLVDARVASAVFAAVLLAAGVGMAFVSDTSERRAFDLGGQGQAADGAGSDVEGAVSAAGGSADGGLVNLASDE